MNKLLLILTSKTTFFILTTLLILGLNLFPLISHIKHAPPGRTFGLIHNNVQDFYFYQSLMNEGANGSWLTYDPYTSENHKPSVIFSYFLALGKVSSLLGLSNAVTYHLLRIILGFLFLLASYFLILNFSSFHRKLTYLLFLFAAPLMNGDKPFMNWWTGVDPIRRVAYLPHHMAGSLLLVLSIIFLIKFFKSGHNKYLLYAIVIAPILAFIHTPSLFILLLILPPTLGLQIALKHLAGGRLIPLSGRSHDSREVEKPIIGLLVYCLIGFFLLILMVSLTKTGFPWSQYIDWEKRLQFPLDKELIGALGYLFPFALIGGIKAVLSKRFDLILIFCWLFIPILFIPFAPRLNISNIRLIQGTPYLPLAILAVMGIITIEKFLKKFSRLLCYCVTVLLALLFIIFTYPTLSWSLKDQIREYWPIFGNVYLDNRLKYAFEFINKNFPAHTVTLATFYTGNYLPASTNTVSFIGHFGYTYNIDEKQTSVQKFFENKMLEKEAKEYLLNNKITLVFQGPEEKPIYKDKLYPEILKPVYDKEEVTLYVLK